jgi:hypothetical protein
MNRRRVDLRHYAAGAQAARVQMMREFKSAFGEFTREIETLRRELSELKAVRDRERRIEAAARAADEGFWLH